MTKSSRIVTVATLLLLWAGTALVGAQTVTAFVPQGGVRASFDGEVAHLQAGTGVLRSPGLLSDFAVEFEFRLLERGTDAALGFRSWPGYGGSPGYRVGFKASGDTRVPQAWVRGDWCQVDACLDRSRQRGYPSNGRRR